MIRSIGLPPTAQVPAVSRQTVEPDNEVPKCVILSVLGVTAPPGAMLMSVPDPLVRVAEVGAVLSVKNTPLTSWPAAVGLARSDDRETMTELALVVMVAEALLCCQS